VIGQRWGVTAQEVARRFPVDDLVPDPAVQAWRGPALAIGDWPMARRQLLNLKALAERRDG
jgi:hypothetical protein